ncbi:MAG TPA: hypothetical protein VFE37_06490 [Chloroflexota bacterium]|nr:hypothetical protein [Chloroflexota bacterium]
MAEPAIRLGRGALAVVARWACPGGVTLRVVRWALYGRERALYRWARGLDFEVGAERWTAGVALERQDGPGGRWQTLARQEIEGLGPTLPEGRLRGWEAGLVARGAKLAARLGGGAEQGVDAPPTRSPSARGWRPR